MSGRLRSLEKVVGTGLQFWNVSARQSEVAGMAVLNISSSGLALSIDTYYSTVTRADS